MTSTQDIVAEILKLGDDMAATGQGTAGIATVAADAGIDFDAALAQLRETVDRLSGDQCSALLVGAVAGIRLARGHEA
jgi:hypothetical protein